MTDPLVSFLRDRWDEEERDARAAAPGPWKAIENYPSAFVVADADGAYIVNESEHGDVVERDATHMARWDPSRVLAEVEAKRAILALHRCDTFLTHVDGHRIELAPPYVCDTCGGHPEAPTVGVWPCPTVLALARPYVDHPAYDPVWAATAPS